ncbi:MAG: C40 family peptidase [Negativicutes bacterium]
MSWRKWLTGATFLLLLCYSPVGWAAAAKYGVGDTGPVVEQIQSGLKTAGYLAGRIDGKFTVQTRQAVFSFQKAAGFKADGVVDEKTYKALTGKKIPPRSTAVAGLHQEKSPNKIIVTALSHRGVKYRFGGAAPTGFDCSGFVMYVYNRHGIKLPRTADKQYEFGKKLKGKNDLKPGDLVFFETYEKGASHVGIYQGNGQFIHASSSKGVTVNRLAETYYAKRYLGARRVL